MPWDYAFNTIIPTTGVKTYSLTPRVTNYLPLTRGCQSIVGNNVTVARMNAAAYDGTYNLDKVTATGATPYVRKTTTGTAAAGRYTASVWLRADTTNTPGTITLTFSDSSGGQAVSTTVTNSGSLQRYSLSSYFDGSVSTLRIEISWTSDTGVVYLDGWQIEDNDWASEMIPNATANVKVRTTYVDPDRLIAIAPYKNGERLAWAEVIQPNQNMTAFDMTAYPYPNLKQYRIDGKYLVLDNVTEGTTLVYYGHQVPTVWTSGTDAVDVPEPYYWILIEGAVSIMKMNIYDIGTNTESNTAYTRFQVKVADLANSVGGWPGWSFQEVIRPVMMR